MIPPTLLVIFTVIGHFITGMGVLQKRPHSVPFSVCDVFHSNPVFGVSGTRCYGHCNLYHSFVFNRFSHEVSARHFEFCLKSKLFLKTMI